MWRECQYAATGTGQTVWSSLFWAWLIGYQLGVLVNTSWLRNHEPQFLTICQYPGEIGGLVTVSLCFTDNGKATTFTYYVYR